MNVGAALLLLVLVLAVTAGLYGVAVLVRLGRTVLDTDPFLSGSGPEGRRLAAGFPSADPVLAGLRTVGYAASRRIRLVA